MDRREFLKCMGLAGLVAASPRLIFDLAANTYKQKPQLYVLGYREMSINEDATYLYIRASRDIFQYDALEINTNFQAEPLSTKYLPQVPALVGVSRDAIPAGEYGFVVVSGRTKLQYSLKI